MTEITLIRHTSVHVPAGMIYGQTDVKLNAGFDEEAIQILTQLKGKYDAVYSSPLSRCKILAEKISSELILDDRLKELNFGDWEEKYWNEIDHTSEAKQWFDDYINVKCPNGESYNDMLIRIKSFLDDLKMKNHSKVCIVTHGGPIRAFLVAIEGIKPEIVFDRKIEYGEVIHLNLSKNPIIPTLH
jgi:alpha-ribazole phosphatase